MRGKALKYLLRKIIKGQKTPKLGYYFVAHPKFVQLTLEQHKGADHLCSQKFMYIVSHPQNLITNSLLLTGNLTDNINNLLTHIFILYVLYTVFIQ